MHLVRPTPTGRPRPFHEHEIIVSKTDLNGRLTYANDIFLRVSEFSEREVIGQPHSLIRHPEMPRAVFKLLWSTIQSGQEIFAYVLNMARSGDHYWVLAHVTPSVNAQREIVGFHSNRRVADDESLVVITALYARLLEEERRHASKADGLAASVALLTKTLAERKQTYDEFIFSITPATV